MAVRRWSSALVPLATVIAFVSLSGCINDPDDIDNAYQDADVRFTDGGSVAGEAHHSHPIDVEAGTSKIRIALRYDVAGEFDVVLKNPLGAKMAEDHADGANERDEDSWYEKSNPTPGTWHLEVDVSGAGDYAVGVYL